jgi:lipoate-protein ligase B
MSVSFAAVDLGLIEYADALELQRRLVAARAAERVPDLLLLCEHPPIVTIGRSGSRDDVGHAIPAHGIPVVAIERGGEVTYHGPGQLVGYPILALNGPERDLHALLRRLEEVILCTLAAFGIAAERVPGRTGVWVGDAKVCAIGVAVRRWVTFHGFALNVHTDLRPFEWIVPCGQRDGRVASMRCLLRAPLDIAAVQAEVCAQFARVFSREMDVWTAADLAICCDGSGR